MFGFSKEQLPIIWVNLIALIAFITLFLWQGNYEFIIYILVILFFAALIIISHKQVHYTNFLLWGLTIWSILHMAGGGVIINGHVLYAQMLWSIIGEPYLIFKYDQLIHAYGFFIATLLVYHVLKPHLNKQPGWFAISFVVIMAGLGLGALNEIFEFIPTILFENTNVGGYVNTALDLVFDLIGGLLAMIWIRYKGKEKPQGYIELE